jgi:hypothetical protein
VTGLISTIFGKLAEWLFGAGVRWFRGICLVLAILISGYTAVASALLWEVDSQPGVMGLWQFTQLVGEPLWTLTLPLLASILTVWLLIPVPGRHSIGFALGACVLGLTEKGQKARAFKRGMHDATACRFRSRSGRIETYGTADGAQDLQVQTHPDSPTGTGAGVCRVSRSCTLHCCPARTSCCLAHVWREDHRRRPERPPPMAAQRSPPPSDPHLPAIKEVRPEYRDIPSPVLQDVLTRLDRGFQRFVARVQAGETPGDPRFQGANR